MKKEMKENYRNVKIDIQEFIKAYAMVDELGSKFFDYCEKWLNAYTIVESYRLLNKNVTVMNEKMRISIVELGMEHFEFQEVKYAKKAYMSLISLDRAYAMKTGRHFKGNTSCFTHEEIAAFLIRFDDAYNAYMSRGHIEYEEDM